MKVTWEGINNLISSSKKKVNQISIIKKPDGSLSTDPSEIPNLLNKHFSSVEHNLASKLPPSKHSFNEYLTNNHLPNSFNFEPVIPTAISAQIQALPLYKSYGMFSCPVKILRSCKHIISQPLLTFTIYLLSKVNIPANYNLPRLCQFIKMMMSPVLAITGLFLFCLYLIEYLKN